jgi:hypothetical protein
VKELEEPDRESMRTTLKKRWTIARMIDFKGTLRHREREREEQDREFTKTTPRKKREKMWRLRTATIDSIETSLNQATELTLLASA